MTCSFRRKSLLVCLVATAFVVGAAALPQTVVAAAGLHVVSDTSLPDYSNLPIAAQILAIILLTLVSEDATCIAVGLAIRENHISPWVGATGCLIGIYIGDLLFFFIGRLGGVGLLKMKFFARRMSAERLQAFGAWFDRRPWAAIAMCRVMPGLRVPLYLAVGALTHRTRAFFWWTCFFAFVWTPALIGLVVLFGGVFVAPFKAFLGGGWKPFVLAIVTIYIMVRLGMMLATEVGRAKLLNLVGRLWGRRPTAVVEDPVASVIGKAPET